MLGECLVVCVMITKGGVGGMFWLFVMMIKGCVGGVFGCL